MTDTHSDTGKIITNLNAEKSVNLFDNVLFITCFGRMKRNVP